MEKQDSQQQSLLQKAIEQIEVFTGPHEIAVGEDGHLMVAQESHLERVIKLAGQTLIPFLFVQKKRQLKKAVLSAREVIQHNLPVIEQFKTGNETEKKFAEYALSIITKYNHIVSNPHEVKKEHFHCDIEFLLQDQEIKGVPIENIASKDKQDQHSSMKTNTTEISVLPMDKKLMQLMIDTCRIKAINWLQTQSDLSLVDLVKLVKQEEFEVIEKKEGSITVKQPIKLSSEMTHNLIGTFEKKSSSNIPHGMSFEIRSH